MFGGRRPPSRWPAVSTRGHLPPMPLAPRMRAAPAIAARFECAPVTASGPRRPPADLTLPVPPGSGAIRVVFGWQQARGRYL